MSIDGVPAVSYSEPENVQGENTQTIKCKIYFKFPKIKLMNPMFENKLWLQFA